MSWGVYDYPEPRIPDDAIPRCPVCGAECFKVYRDRNHEVIGCDECVEEEDATDCEECYE